MFSIKLMNNVTALKCFMVQPGNILSASESSKFINLFRIVPYSQPETKTDMV